MEEVIFLIKVVAAIIMIWWCGEGLINYLKIRFRRIFKKSKAKTYEENQENTIYRLRLVKNEKT